jgi:hypothetical protein
MELVAILKNKYFQIIAGILIALVLGFSSGYSYKADKVELERLQQFELIQGKLDKVREFSQEEARRNQSSMLELDARLGTILGRVKQKPLTNVPCVPSEDFSKIWSEIDNVTKKSDIQ